MAKKATGKVKKHDQKTMAKVIIPFKSPKTNTYKYKERMVRADQVQALLK